MKPFESDVLCTDFIGSSVAGPPKKQRQAYTSYTFCIMSAMHPTVCYICIKLLPGTSAFSVSKQPPLLFTLNEPSPPPLRPSVLSITHSVLTCLQESFKSGLHVIRLWMSAIGAPACCSCPRPSHVCIGFNVSST